jgi:hypothetical protein
MVADTSAQSTGPPVPALTVLEACDVVPVALAVAPPIPEAALEVALADAAEAPFAAEVDDAPPPPAFVKSECSPASHATAAMQRRVPIPSAGIRCMVPP